MCKALLLLLVLAGVASAQPSPGAQTDRTDAKALVGSGVKLLDAKDYLGALAIFKDAYSRFPSAKILLNIGTTYRLLGRDAEAANTYQKYLDSKDADAKRAVEVRAALGELDAHLGRLALTITPEDSEVGLGDEWIPASQAKLLRFAPGQITLQVRHAKYQNGTVNAKLDAGAQVPVTLALVAIAEPTPPSQPAAPPPTLVGEPRVEVTAVSDRPRSRIGAIANVHVAVYPKLGSAWLVGGTLDVLPALSIDAAILLGPGLVSDGMASLPPPSLGGYVGANYAFAMGNVRPRVGVGIPIFASDGARLSVRGALGVELVASRHVSIAIDVGAEYALNPQDDIRTLAIVPAAGVAGRL